MPNSADEELVRLRIAVAILEEKLHGSDMALKLAHDNLRAYLALAVTVTGIVVALLMRLWPHG